MTGTNVQVAALEIFMHHDVFQDLLQVHIYRAWELWLIPRNQGLSVSGLSVWSRRYVRVFEAHIGALEEQLDIISWCSKRFRDLVDGVSRRVRRPDLSFRPLDPQMQMSFACSHVFFDMALVILHLNSLAPKQETGRFENDFWLEFWIDKDADDICKTHVRDFAHLSMTSHRHYEFARKLIFGHWQPRIIARSLLGVSCRRSVTRRVSEALELHRRPAALRDLDENFKLTPNDYFDLWL